MSLLSEETGVAPENNSKKILIAAVAIGVIAVAIAIALFSLKPSQVIVEQESLQGALREDSPEFQTFTKRISVQTDENQSFKSQTALGGLTFSVGGTVRNFTGRNITGLEVNVKVIDEFNNVLKEKNSIIIPRQRAVLDNNQVMSARVVIEGFDPKADIANVRWKVTAIKLGEQ